MNGGIHEEYISKIVFAYKCCGGIEGAKVEIYGSQIVITSKDDALNEANKDLPQYDFSIYIGGENIQNKLGEILFETISKRQFVL